MSDFYGGLLFTPMRQPPIPRSTPMAPQPPYVGAELARLTSMTPFDGGQFSPVYMRHPVADRNTRRVWGGNPPPSEFYRGRRDWTFPNYGGYGASPYGAYGAVTDPRFGTGVNLFALHALKKYSSGKPDISGTDLVAWQDVVKAIQQCLIDLNYMRDKYCVERYSGDVADCKRYTSSVDGKYMGMTHKGIKKVQKGAGLSQTGESDKYTLEALQTACITKQNAPATTKSALEAAMKLAVSNMKTAEAANQLAAYDAGQVAVTPTGEVVPAAAAPPGTTPKAKDKKKGSGFWSIGNFEWGDWLASFSKPRVTPTTSTQLTSGEPEKGSFPWGAAIFGTVAIVGILAVVVYIAKED